VPGANEWESHEGTKHNVRDRNKDQKRHTGRPMAQTNVERIGRGERECNTHTHAHDRSGVEMQMVGGSGGWEEGVECGRSQINPGRIGSRAHWLGQKGARAFIDAFSSFALAPWQSESDASPIIFYGLSITAPLTHSSSTFMPSTICRSFGVFYRMQLLSEPFQAVCWMAGWMVLLMSQIR
jgi:hypothetical protein